MAGSMNIPGLDAMLSRSNPASFDDGFGEEVDAKTDEVLAALETLRAKHFPHISDARLCEIAYEIAETEVDEKTSLDRQDAEEARL